MIKCVISDSEIKACTRSIRTISSVVVTLFEFSMEFETYNALKTSTLKIIICGSKSYLVPNAELIRFLASILMIGSRIT